MADQPGARSLRFETADLPAAADEPGVGADGVVTELAGAHLVTQRERALRDEAPSDPRSERQQDEVLRPLADTVRVLAQRGAARIVGDEHGALRKRVAHALTERYVLPTEIRRVADRPARRIDVAGRADPDPGDVVLGCRDRAADDVGEHRDYRRRRVVLDLVLEPGMDRSGFIDCGGHHVRAAQIDADRSPRHQCGAVGAGAGIPGAVGAGAGVGGGTPGGASTALAGSSHLS